MSEVSSPEHPKRVVRRCQPVPAKEDRGLAYYEDLMRTGFKDFVRIGKALTNIKTQKLYRVEHSSFQAYCHTVWRLAPRTVHQKLAAYVVYERLAAAYRAEERPLDSLPTQESHVRPLLTLRDESLQRQAWEAAVNAWETDISRSGPITAAYVARAVRDLQARRRPVTFVSLLTPSRAFSRIPWCLDVNAASVGSATIRLRPELLDDQLVSHAAAATTSPPLVLVSPDQDLWRFRPKDGVISQLCKVFARATDYRFVLWTESLDFLTQNTQWPPTVDVAFRAHDQEGINAFVRHCKTHPSPYALWVEPDETITIPTIALTRLLFSLPRSSSGYNEETLTNTRLLAIAALQAEYPVHFHFSVRTAFTGGTEALQPQPLERQPLQPQMDSKRCSKKVLAAMLSNPD